MQKANRLKVFGFSPFLPDKKTAAPPSSALGQARGYLPREHRQGVSEINHLIKPSSEK